MSHCFRATVGIRQGIFAVAASAEQAERVSRLLDRLVRAVEARGWQVVDGEPGLHLAPEGEEIGFELAEQTQRVPHRRTEAERLALEKYEAAKARVARSRTWSYVEPPAISEWDYEPTGQLVLTLAEGAYVKGMRRKFSDGKTQRLEQLVGPILESLAVYAASRKAARQRAERERLAAADAEARRQEALRVRTLEEKRREFLKRQMQRHRRAVEVEAFVADVEAEGPPEGAVSDIFPVRDPAIPYSALSEFPVTETANLPGEPF
jgi:hypothetical protein